MLAYTPALASLAPECKGCPGTFCKGCHETEHKVRERWGTLSGVMSARSRPNKGGPTRQAFNIKAGESQYEAANTHLPENTGDKAMDAIVVELKK